MKTQHIKIVSFYCKQRSRFIFRHLTLIDVTSLLQLLQMSGLGYFRKYAKIGGWGLGIYRGFEERAFGNVEISGVNLKKWNLQGWSRTIHVEFRWVLLSWISWSSGLAFLSDVAQFCRISKVEFSFSRISKGKLINLKNSKDFLEVWPPSLFGFYLE